MTINDIISELVSSNRDILSILRKVKVIAFKINNQELGLWVDNELNGYIEIEILPDYRKTHCVLQGNVTNGYQLHNNITLPIAHLDDNAKEALTGVNFNEPISELIELSTNDQNFINTSVDPNYFHYIETVYSKGYHIQSAHGVLPVSVVKGIISIIENRLLEFLLELSKIIDSDIDIIKITTLSDVSANTIHHLTQQIIYGNLVTTTNQLNPTGDIIINYAEELKNKGIHEDDIEELKEIAKIKNETEKQKQKEGWMRKVGVYLPTITTMVDFIDTAMEAFL